ncbi:DUF4192 domain-containing protein [Nocardioides marmorisolisilvae]|uniref:DUF4192 domain-containing protein n=1 Tax=Nocardioides marmorisolisilvae TaxID=1542737 RepID=A0A3N0DVL4_9ACTN|nr:DUF4192 domain-containing protein [Nocardioides marmorisolisilvae]RNL79644.1 DUF4192 domain-containing protein [Nocardioides marmorisolisilvae]
MHPFIAQSPVDLLAVVPIAIGFHPEDSVVLLAFDAQMPGAPARRGETFHARVDLPRTDEHRDEVAQLLINVVRRHRVGMVGLLVYTEDIAESVLFADLFVPQLVAAGVVVVDVLRVGPDRFYALGDPSDPGVPYDLSSHPFTARQVLSGRVVHQNRAALMDSLIGEDEADSEALGRVADTYVDELLASGHTHGRLGELLRGEARWLQRRIRSYLRSPRPLAPLVAGRVLVLVAFDALREVAWAEMTRGQAHLHVELWRDLTRRAPADLRSGAGGLLAFAAWLAGDGALACCALDRCFGTDPEDRMARQVVALLESATPPTVWAPIPQSALRVFTIGSEPTDETPRESEEGSAVS